MRGPDLLVASVTARAAGGSVDVDLHYIDRFGELIVILLAEMNDNLGSFLAHENGQRPGDLSALAGGGRFWLILEAGDHSVFIVLECLDQPVFDAEFHRLSRRIDADQ